jgi:hypothetical protein
MYTHSQKDENGNLSSVNVNYQDYLNKGRSLGTAVPPNSHRVSLRGKFNPIEGLYLNPAITYIQHSNVNESIPWENAIQYLKADPGRFNTDGGNMDNPDAGGGYFPYAQENFMFMAQKTKQHIFQVGLDTEWEIPRFPIGTFSVKFSYLFEFIQNDGVDKNMFPGRNLQTEGMTNEQQEQIVADAIDNWKQGLKDTFNNYFSIGIKFIY